MFKTFLLAALSITLVQADSACDSCSPECLDCRVRGYTRLSPDHYSADCYLEYVPARMASEQKTIKQVEGPCDAFPDATLVCRRQRCSLDNGERCKLLGLNASQCPHYIASQNSALNGELAGCYTYAPLPSNNGQCANGYTAFCKFQSVTDFIGDAAGLDPETVYAPITGQAAFRAKDTTSAVFDISGSVNSSRCSDTITLDNGVVAKLALEACVNNQSSIFPSPWATAVQQNTTCQQGSTLLTVQGTNGCYVVTPSNGQCLRFPLIDQKSGAARKASAQIIPIGPTPINYTSQCYYWIDPKDNDPTFGCNTPVTPITKSGEPSN